MYTYEYTDDTPRDFPTLGLREVNKGTQIQSEQPLNSPFLKEVKPQIKPSTPKGSDE